ncbi:MAG: HAMP domain-containing histidine kinase [Bacteroidales bacterium]|nr:HAMP domain-containing histidine kinase [Bacteroidales bacterium]
MFIISILVVISAMWATFVVVRKISDDEHRKVKMWASSVQRKAELIEYSQNFFEQIEIAERNKLEVWANAMLRWSHARTAAEFDLYRQIVGENTTIPVIITNKNLQILHCANMEIDCPKMKTLKDSLLIEFSIQKPLNIEFSGNNWFFFYQHPKAFIELRQILDNIIHSFIDEIVSNSIFAPILVVSEDEKTVIQAGNISPERYVYTQALKNTLKQMRAQNTPIEFSINADETYLIFYESSMIVRRLVYLPIIAFVIFTIFIGSIIWGMGVSKQSENNKLWLGISRETAHQLGTPISSLMGWIELFRSQQIDENLLVEMEKDINRLTIISERFSKIGSEPTMNTQNIIQMVYKSTSYLQPRLSRKLKFHVDVLPNVVMLANANTQLIEWVLENLITNAVDAIGTKENGLVEINITEQFKTVTIDITDNGKGIPKAQWKTIFEAGFTTKPRGWGLGLSLCYRIIHNYHKGDILVKNSVVGEGTTMRIILNK